MCNECDNCEFYGIEDTCAECRSHRQITHRHNSEYDIDIYDEQYND